MAEFKKVLSASLGGGMLAMGAMNAKAVTVTMAPGATLNSPTLGVGQTTIASYYGAGGSNYTDSSPNYTPNAGNHPDPQYGLDTFVSSHQDQINGDPHGNSYIIGQSFSTGSNAAGYALNQVAVMFGDADSGAGFSASTETITIYKLDSSTGKLTSVGAYTATGTPYEAKTGLKQTVFTFTGGASGFGGPTLSGNSTYAFSINENSGSAAALLIPKAVSNSSYGNPGGTTSQQLVSVNETVSAGEQSFLTYSGYSSRNNSQGNAANSPAETGTDYYVDNTTTKINTAASSNGYGTNPVPPIGIFSGANSLGIDQLNFYVVATPVPEPASLGVMGVAGLGLLARRRRKV